MDVLICLAPVSSDRLQDPWKYGGCSTLHCDTGSSWISSALPGQHGLMQLPGSPGPKIGSAWRDDIQGAVHSSSVWSAISNPDQVGAATGP